MDLKKLTRNFNIKEYLEDIGITYDEGGDNVTQGWINIQCCFCSDHANHLGINLKTKTFSCWRCKISSKDVGGLPGLIKELEGINFSESLNRLKQYQNKNIFEDFFNESIIKNYNNDPKKVLPEEFKKIEEGEEPPLVKKYFKKRKFPLSNIQKYEAGWCRVGKYAYHLILPIYIDNIIVSFLAADMTGINSPKYNLCPDYKALIPRNKILYGLDDIRNSEQVIIVEGYTDRWRIGKRNSVALLYSTWSAETLIALQSKVKKDCIIKVMLDLDAIQKGQELAENIQTLFPDTTYFIELEKKDHASDPDELSPKQVKKILSLKL